MALSQQRWIQADNGMAYVGGICDFFKAAIAHEDAEEEVEESEDSEENVESTPDPTHGVWATMTSGESRLIYQGSENRVNALMDKLIKGNNAVDLSYLIPSDIE